MPDGTPVPALNARGLHLVSSLVHCVTDALVIGFTWVDLSPQNFMKNFEVKGYRVVSSKDRKPIIPADETAIKNTLSGLADLIELLCTRGNSLTAYVDHLVYLLRSEVQVVPVRNKTEFRYRLHKLYCFALNTHIALIPSVCREMVLLRLRTSFESLSRARKVVFFNAVAQASQDLPKNWKHTTANDAVMGLLHKWVSKRGGSYEVGMNGAFRFLRNFGHHAPENCYVSICIA